jgi:hypothetical protein
MPAREYQRMSARRKPRATRTHRRPPASPDGERTPAEQDAVQGAPPAREECARVQPARTGGEAAGKTAEDVPALLTRRPRSR